MPSESAWCTTKDLKLNDLKNCSGILEETNYLTRMARNQYHGCPMLQKNNNIVQDRRILKETLGKLRYQMSDEALQKMTDFQQSNLWIESIVLAMLHLTVA